MRIETKIRDVTYDPKTEMIYFGDHLSIFDKEAVSAAKQNIQSQADDTYFDGAVSFIIDEEPFFEAETSELSGLWIDLINFRNYIEHKLGKIHLLDNMIEFFIEENNTGYQLKYIDMEDTVNEKNELVDTEYITRKSKLIDKETFEKAVRKGFLDYRTFIVDNNLPISAEQLDELNKLLKV